MSDDHSSNHSDVGSVEDLDERNSMGAHTPSLSPSDEKRADHSDSASEGHQSDSQSITSANDNDGNEQKGIAATANDEDEGDPISSLKEVGEESGESSPSRVQRNVVNSDGEESEDDEATGPPTRNVIIDNEDEDDEEQQQETANTSKSSAGQSFLNKDDFDGGSSPRSEKSGGGVDDDNDRGDDAGGKKLRRVIGSDSEDEADSEKKPGNEDANNLNNIFGDDSSDEGEGDEKDKDEQKAEDSDDAEAKLLRVEGDSDDQRGESDFDKMLRKKKAERKRKYKRNKGDSILLTSDMDDQVKMLVEQMADAAAEDRLSNQDKRPAIQKRKLLSVVRSTLLKADLFETLLDNGMMNGLSEWLAPLPDKSLPALEVRSTLLKILEGYPPLDQGILKQSGLGKAVMFLYKHPKETRENKEIAAKLIREWSRPIFQLDTDFRSLSKDERVQRDFEHMPVIKRRRLSVDADGIPITPSKSRAKSDNTPTTDETDSKRKINRARVPKPSTKDYVIRPRPVIEGRFQGASKNRQTDRYDKAQREFNERNRAQKAKRAIGVSINKDAN